MRTSKYFNDIIEGARRATLDVIYTLLDDHEVTSINLLPYKSENGLESHRLTATDRETGISHAMTIDSLTYQRSVDKDGRINRRIILDVDGADGAVLGVLLAEDLNPSDTTALLEELEDLFDIIEGENLPILKEGEEFD